ncbi:hypothetical protein [Halosolutus gelatinilyticus]|uniref:hypothetical protein n=1 Tax=Halosolutus gelatinilyticus TaxID=2931975 RepID=UPI001FF4C2C8|nr:hypothetical protein [Halosolutus gelatinilyticus]
MQLPATREVACPRCDERTSVRVPREDAELNVRHSVAAFGEYTTVTCSNGHRYWVYFC